MTQTSSLPQLALAPMEGVSDFPVRVWFALAAAPARMHTPFLRVTATFPHKEIPELFAPELTVLRGAFRYELIPQLMAAEIDHFTHAAHMLLPQTSFIDLNCGCPAPKVVGHGAGSSILKSVERFGATIDTLTKALGPNRLSVKMRTGFDSTTAFEELLRTIEQQPLKQLTVHGRTRLQRYRDKADWSLIDIAARKVVAPVVGSGDINSINCLEARRAQAPHVRAHVIGRGALRNPWIFKELDSGQSQTIVSHECLQYSLAVLAILLEAHFTEPTKLVSAVADLAPMTTCNADVHAWEKFFNSFQVKMNGHAVAIDNLTVSRRTLGRLKMHWSYMRSSLESDFFSPLLLRSKSWNEFLNGLTDLQNQYYQANRKAAHALSYQPQHDWIYSGASSKEDHC